MIFARLYIFEGLNCFLFVLCEVNSFVSLYLCLESLINNTFLLLLLAYLTWLGVKVLFFFSESA